MVMFLSKQLKKQIAGIDFLQKKLDLYFCKIHTKQKALNEILFQKVVLTMIHILIFLTFFSFTMTKRLTIKQTQAHTQTRSNLI